MGLSKKINGNNQNAKGNDQKTALKEVRASVKSVKDILKARPDDAKQRLQNTVPRLMDEIKQLLKDAIHEGKQENSLVPSGVNAVFNDSHIPRAEKDLKSYKVGVMLLPLSGMAKLLYPDGTIETVGFRSLPASLAKLENKIKTFKPSD